MANVERKILIYGVPHGGDGGAVPYVKMSYHGSRAVGAVPSSLVPTGPEYLLSDLRWNLEDFATKDPFNATKAERTAKNLERYTFLLIQFVLDTLGRPEDLLGSRLIVKLSDQWIGSSLPLAVNNGANVVPLMQWECLENVDMWPTEHKPEAVTVIRCTSCRNVQEEMPPTPLTDGKPVRVLALSARPHGDRDIPHRLITRTIYRVIQSLQDQRYPPELHVARPGSLESLVRALSSFKNGYFDVVHLDVHGVADEKRQVEYRAGKLMH